MLSPLLQMAKKTVTTASILPFQATFMIAKVTAKAIIDAGKKASRIF